MKLDRDLNKDGCGKYAIINLRKLNDLCGHAGPFQRWPLKSHRRSRRSKKLEPLSGDVLAPLTSSSSSS